MQNNLLSCYYNEKYCINCLHNVDYNGKNFKQNRKIQCRSGYAKAKN